MYGLVNRAIRSLVIEKADIETWRQICREVNLTHEDFSLMQTYPDEITYNLVGAVAKKLNITPFETLRAFGRYWILYTASEGYGEIMSMFGQDFETCLRNLNNMHSRMGTMMTDLVPPRFTVESMPGNVLKVTYNSKRVGLAPMVLGLLEGLTEKFAISASIEFVPSSNPEQGEIFTIKREL